MPKLTHAPHEHFARLVAAKMPRYKAYKLAVARTAKESNLRARASQLWRGRWRTSESIRNRVSELQMMARKSTELTAERLLDDLLLDADMAHHAGQYSAAISARKLIGSEMFAMFKERRETLNIDLSINTKDQLRAEMIRDYGQECTDYLFQLWDKPSHATAAKQLTLVHDSREDKSPPQSNLEADKTNVLQFPQHEPEPSDYNGA